MSIRQSRDGDLSENLFARDLCSHTELQIQDEEVILGNRCQALMCKRMAYGTGQKYGNMINDRTDI